MLLLNKWTLTGTLALLSHPERERRAAVVAAEASTEQSRYAEAYDELMDEEKNVTVYSKPDKASSTSGRSCSVYAP